MSEEKLPLEILREKYLPIEVFPDMYGISVPKIMSMIKDKKIKYAEFRAPGATRRTIHVNYLEVLSVIEKEKNL